MCARAAAALAAALLDPLARLTATLVATCGCWELFRPSAFPFVVHLCRRALAGVRFCNDCQRLTHLRARYRLILRVMQDVRRRSHCRISPAWEALEELQPPPPLPATLASFARSAFFRFTATSALFASLARCATALAGPLARVAATCLAWVLLRPPVCSLAALAGRWTAAGARSLVARCRWPPGSTVTDTTLRTPLRCAVAPPHPDAPRGGGGGRGKRGRDRDTPSPPPPAAFPPGPPLEYIGRHVLIPFNKGHRFEGIIERYEARHRDRDDRRQARWQVYFPEDGDRHWLPWGDGNGICAGLIAAQQHKEAWGAADRETSASTVARQLPPGGGTELPGLLSSIGRHHFDVARDGNCAYHSVGHQLGQPDSTPGRKHYSARDADKLRAATAAFLATAPPAWADIYTALEWAATLRDTPVDRNWAGSAALRALAVTCQRDLVLLNGLPGSAECRVTIFYADAAWVGNNVLYDLLPAGTIAFHAWLQDGSGGAIDAPARTGAPLFVIYNGVNHFDSAGAGVGVQRPREPTPKHHANADTRGAPAPAPTRPSKAKGVPAPPAVGAAAAKAAHAAANSARADGASINDQRDRACSASARLATSYGAAGATCPCFLCGAPYANLKGHWAERNLQSGATSGSACAAAWAVGGALPLAASIANAPSDGAGPTTTPEGETPPSTPAELPWDFAALLLAGGALHRLPPPESMPDIPRGARTKVSKAFGLVLARGAITPHDDGAAAAYHLFVRWVIRRDGWHVKAVRQGKKSCSPPPEEAGAFDSVAKRAQAFLDGRWHELHAAYLDTVSTTAKAAAAAARANAELRRQESACAKVGEGAYSKGMAALLDKGAVEPDGDRALAVLTPLHPAFGAMTAEQRAEVKSWVEAVSDPHTATPEDMAHALATAAKAAAPGPSGLRTSHLRRMLLENEVHMRNFTTWTNGAFCTGMLPDAQREAWAAARALALGKEVGGHRPISTMAMRRAARPAARLCSHTRRTSSCAFAARTTRATCS